LKWKDNAHKLKEIMKMFISTSMSKLRRKLQCVLMLVVISLSGFSQGVAINSTLNPANADAGLDIDFPNTGFLVPRVALTGASLFAPLAAHIPGMLLYNTAITADLFPGLYVNNGTNWVSFSQRPGTAVGDMQYWSGTLWTTLPAGQPGQLLQLTSSGIPAWSNGVFSTLSTAAVTSITSISASSGGNITSDGGTAITARGVCWNTSTGPTVANSKTIDGTGVGSFTSSLTGLTTATTYYIRAYATNSAGTTYGNEISFVTP